MHFQSNGIFMKHPLMSFLVLASVAVTACDSSHRNTAGRNKPIVDASVPGTVAYSTVDSIFKNRCVSCHSGSDPADGLDLTTYDGLIKGTSHGAVITVGNPTGSVMMDALLGAGGKKGDPNEHIAIAGKFPDEEVKTIAAWIREGAQPDSSVEERIFAILRLYVIHLDNAERGFFSGSRRYTSSLDSLGVVPVAGVNITFSRSDASGWEARVTHPQSRISCVSRGSAGETRVELNLETASRFCAGAP